MQKGNKKNTTATKEQPAPAGNYASGNSNVDENVKAAFETAEDDIKKDPDLSIQSPNDDLDEGETARLGEDKTDLV